MDKAKLDANQNIQKYLFDKGFLLTNKEMFNLNEYPFYGNWRSEKVRNLTLLTHKRAKFFIREYGAFSLVLVGHAYNPFSMESDENVILDKIASRIKNNEYQDNIDELTGVFFFAIITDDAVKFQLDASGMQYGCYGRIDETIYIASHMQLIGDVCGLKQSDFVKRLTSYKWYHYMMGNYLPGDITCFSEIKRIIPNTEITYKSGNFEIERFYPNRQINMADTVEEYGAVIKEASHILKNTMNLITKKWQRPAISLTGGIDSNTTFAAANGIYDKYSTFSYVSMPREDVDAEKAKEISDKFNVPFKKYVITNDNAECEDFELYKEIFIHNDGEIGRAKDDDTRKKITLINTDVCDVEVKSWISETIRAYAYKYYGRKKFPKKLRPRIYTSLYKIFLGNRKIAVETDKYFKDYIERTKLAENLFNYDYTDFFVWEMMHGGKCGLNIGVMKSCFDITIPYNNRKLLDLLLRVPLSKRISDEHHLDLKKTMNKELFDMNIRVVNLNETKARKKAINAYYIINTHLPF